MTVTPAETFALLNLYAAGPELLRQAVSGFNHKQLRTPASPGKWSVMEIVCHIADAEIFYADRIKRVLVEDRPTMFCADPEQFVARLGYDTRDLEEELAVVTSIRAQVTRILRTATAADFERVGVHSADGPLTLTGLLKRIANHIPHHNTFIAAKRPVLMSST